MKKQFFYAALAIALMSSCSKDNDPGTTTDPTDPTVPEVIDDTTPAAIQLGIGNPTIIATRGTGSVGDLSTNNAANIWKGQALQILMVAQGTMTDAQDNGANIFAGETFTAPTGAGSGFIKFNTGNVKYYPMQGKFDFYGYHMDTDQAPIEDRNTVGSIIVTATIDGTNDIMAATTKFSSEDSIKLINNALTATGETYKYQVVANKTIERNDNNSAITDPANSADLTLLGTELAKAYSSYAARRGVQPTLIFKHLMSRLKFHVRAGEEKAGLDYYKANATAAHYFPTFAAGEIADGEYDASATPTYDGEVEKTDGAVYIKSIKVTGQKSGISLTFTPAAGPVLAGTGEATAEFTLMERDKTETNTAKKLVALTPIAPANGPAGAATAIGESMMILSNESSFNIEIKVMQYVMTNDGQGTTEGAPTNPVYKWKVSSLKTTVNAPKTMPNPAYTDGNDGQPKSIPSTDKIGDNFIFAVGKSYNINVTVYGNQPIEVTAELTGWISGDDVEVNPEDDEFNKVNP